MALGPKRNVQYPYALGPSGDIVHIEQHEKQAGPCACLSCEQPMVARQGKVVGWHFAHKGQCCSGEGALHRATVRLIQQGFRAAKEADRPYSLRWTCGECGDHREEPDCTGIIDDVDREASVVPRVRSDLYFSGRGAFAVEVVVTHPIEPETEQRYSDAKCRVLVVEPTWESLAAMATGLTATSTLELSSAKCLGCQELGRKREAKIQTSRELREFLIQLPNRPSGRLREWAHDKQGNVLRPWLLENLGRTSRRLLRMGFEQSESKPWSFCIMLPKGYGRLFAHLGGTDEIPIWTDRSPMLHWLLNGPEWRQEAIVKEFLSYCERNGLRWRLSHYARSQERVVNAPVALFDSPPGFPHAQLP